MSTPFVSVIVPVRNEAPFIGRTLDRILSQDYPLDRLEIIVADGMSDDGTREIVGEYCARYPQVKAIVNPRRITPAGLNAAIAVARGEIISRVDGHCEIASDFIRQNVALLEEHPEAWAVGGPIVHAGRSLFGRAVAVAQAHPAGVGLATHRFERFEGYVEGPAFPAIRRWVFDRVGMFDEHLVRTEDDEFTYRIAQAGGKCYVSPRVKYVYYVRGRIGQLFKQYFQYSFWRIPVVRKHGRPTTVRQVVPPLFFLAMIVLAIAGAITAQPLVALALPALYGAALIAVAIGQVPRRGVAVASLVPVAIATMHVAYAAGIAYGLWAAAFRPTAWDLRGGMTTISR